MSRRRIALLGPLTAVAILAVPSTLPAHGQGLSTDLVYFVANCEDEAFQPRTIVVTCADENFTIRSIRWSAWTTTAASGTGSARINDCVPSCATGRFRSFRGVTVRLSRPVVCTEDGLRQFSQLTYRFGTSRPADFPKRGTQLSRCPTQAGR
jgi:hypothetical protein